MKHPVKILGLGRCAIGHLRKNILQDQDTGLQLAHEQIQFDHHYILNPLPILESNIAEHNFAALSHAACAPSLFDQIKCLQKVKEYDVCIIEVFPPSCLYVNGELRLFACFESFTNELEGLGFRKITENDPFYNSHTDAAFYVKSLIHLVQKIRQLNKDIRIILINAELLFEEPDKPIGLPILHVILENIRKELNNNLKDISLLDMNDILQDLSEKGMAFYDTEFPLLYVRHDSDLVPIAVARDCKHASPFMRRRLVTAVYQHLLQDGFSLSPPDPLINDRQQFKTDFTARAKAFFKKFDPKTIDSEFQDPRIFARLVGYTLITNSTEGHDYIKKFIFRLSSYHFQSSEDLVKYFYHIRSIAAYLYIFPFPSLVSLTVLGIKTLNLEQEAFEKRSNFILLWLKNIYIALLAVLPANPYHFQQHIFLFYEKLKNNTFLKHFHEIQLICHKLSSEIPIVRSASSKFSESSSKIKRIGIFLPRSTPLYISMFFGLKRGFESLGMEVAGWPELLKQDALLEFCRQFKPDVIIEMNRSRQSLPHLSQEILHICWIVDLMGNEYSFFRGSDIIYTFGSFWPQFFCDDKTSFADWLPPGIDPSYYFFEKQEKMMDFSFIGHIPLPWNQKELKRPLWETATGTTTFGDFIEQYEKSWDCTIIQSTPSEIIQQMGGKSDLSLQDIDIEDLTLRYDILCRSRRMKIRQSLIDAVIPISDSIHIYGPENWKKWPHYAKYYKKFIDNPHELRKVYQTTRLNLHEGVSLHMRLLDCFASGGCLLYLNPDERNSTGNGISFFFEEGTHYLKVDKKNLTSQIKEYLKNETLREKISRNAAEIVHAHHTWKHRAQKVLSDCKYIRS